MSLVLDSSVTAAWFYSEETTPAIRHVQAIVAQNGAWAPTLWKLEIANIFQMGVRRRRTDAAFRDAALTDLALLPIHLDAETDRQAWGAILHLAVRHNLTLYDAAYLELSKRRGLPLATLDADLRAAAHKEKVPLLGL